MSKNKSSQPTTEKCVELSNPDIWDDTLLIKAYDAALKISKEEVAKRLANLTNKKEVGSISESTDNENDSESRQSSDSKKEFKVGHHVRATYIVDGIDYEAKILEIQDNGDCVIEFIGYGNEQIVNMSNLLPTWGRKSRLRQIAEANEAATSEMECDDDDALLQSEIGSVQEKLTRKQRGRSHVKVNGMHPFGATPGNMMIPPPPPMPPMLNDATEDSEHLSAMLMAWYMSGYYTGLYQGQKLARNGSTAVSSKRNKK